MQDDNKKRTWEPLGGGVEIQVSAEHRFCTDTVLLAHFSLPRPGEVCVDLGTGCGAIPLLWATRAKPSRIYGVEVQPEAVEIARASVLRNRLDGRVTILQQDLTDWPGLREKLQPEEAGAFHLVSCNPPYSVLGNGSASSIQAQATARHECLCTFDDVAATAERLLRWGGRFCFCLRPERLAEACATVQRHGMEPKRLRLVQQRPGKSPFLFLLQAVRGGRPGLTVDPVLFIEEPGVETPGGRTGQLSAEMRAIYGNYKEGHEV